MPVDGIGGKPAGITSIPGTSTSSSPAAADVTGQVTNRSWAPAGGRPADGDATKFEQAGKAPGWLGIGGQAISGGLRLLVGKLKDVPVLGNVLNLVDAGVDAVALAGKLITGKGTPQERAKNATDLVMHTIGIFKKSVGADYDKGQGRMRLAIAGAEAGAKVLGIDIPPEMRQWAPVLVAGYGAWSGFTPRNADGSEKGPALGAWSTLAIAAGTGFVLPKVKNLLTGGN